MSERDPSTPIISSSFKNFLTRRVEEMIGLGLVLLSLVMLAILITADRADASSETVNSLSENVSNLLGSVGAKIAATQTAAIGIIAAYGLALMPMFWGLKLLRHLRPTRLRLRLLVIMPISLVLIAFSATVWLGKDLGGGAGWVVAEWTVERHDMFNMTLPPPLAMVKYEYIFTSIATVFALGLYAYGAAIGRSEMRLLSISARMMRRGVMLVLAPFARIITAITGQIRAIIGKPRPIKAKTLSRKTPQPRRDPVVVTTDGDGDDAPSRTLAAKKPTKISAGQQSLDLENASGYRLPSVNHLTPPNKVLSGPDADVLDANSRLLEGVLVEFGVRGEIEKARFGPVVTRYELSPAPGTKTQRVIGLADDIARSMSALSVRVAVVPGQNVIGVELPNADRQTVLLRDVFDHKAWAEQSASLPMALGMDISGHPVVADLAKMPHLLVAGTTGSGKSVGINAMILSLLYTHTPETCRLIMIDPKMLELSVYDGIPHLLTPVVTDPGKAVTALKWAVREMENRYRNMSKLGVRNIDGYNQRLSEARRKGEVLSRRVQTGFDAESGRPVFEEEALDLSPLPFIVVLIDEVADLMMVAGKDIEAAVQRLAQMARAAGIHVVMATQRPSVDVITGTIKANFPTRISFQVTSKIDSRTILGEQGAEQLLGRGDMLYMEGGGRIVRVHGPFVSDTEVEEVANFLRQQGEPVYDDNVTQETDATPDRPDGAPSDDASSDGNGDASLYDQAVALVAREGKASTSFVQRHLRIGYNRAATIIEEMERNGVISPANHAGKREVLIDADI